MGSLRIFIACTDEKLRLALLMLIDDEPHMTVVGFSDRLMGLITQLEGAEPEVLVLDWEIAKAWTYNLLHDLQSLPTQPKTIVLSNRLSVKESLLAAGAAYFIPKDSPPDALLPALNDIRLSLVNNPSSGGV